MGNAQPDHQQDRELPARRRLRASERESQMSVSPNVMAAMRARGNAGRQHAAYEVERLANSGVRAEAIAGGSHRRGGPAEHELPASRRSPTPAGYLCFRLTAGRRHGTRPRLDETQPVLDLGDAQFELVPSSRVTRPSSRNVPWSVAPARSPTRTRHRATAPSPRR